MGHFTGHHGPIWQSLPDSLPLIFYPAGVYIMSLNDTYFLTPAHLEIAKARYFRKGDNGLPIETDIEQVFDRECGYTFQNDQEHLQEALQLRKDKKILPAGRPLAQAGTDTKNLSNCFYLPFEDDTKEAISKLKAYHLKVQAAGGGVGIDFSTLRPKGSICKTNQARSSGTIGFLTDLSFQAFNVMQGGNRSGANLGTLHDWHPDLYDFITHKSSHNHEQIRAFSNILDEDGFSYWQWENPYQWQTFNVSVMLSDKFMQQVQQESEQPWITSWQGTQWHLWDFINPTGPITGKPYERKITVSAPDEEMARYKAACRIPYFNAKDLTLEKGPYDLTASEWFKLIAEHAWMDGCPGIVFIDRIRQYHNGEYFNRIQGLNPCGEQALPSYGVCSLNSVILPTFYTKKGIDWDELKRTIHLAVRGLDNLVDLTKTGIQEIDDNTVKERRIGLSTTGIAELLILEGLRYNSQEGRDYTENLLRFIRDEAYEASINLAKERGPFPAFDFQGYSQSAFFKTLPDNIQKKIEQFGIRNVTILSGAPIGTTGSMVGYSQGVEPYFMLQYMRNSRVGSFIDGSPAFRVWLKENDIDYSEYDYSIRKLREAVDVPDYFIESHEINPEDHIKMTAVFAKYCGSNISKTVNAPKNITPFQVEQTFLLAYSLGLKSCTVYRDGSKQQILESIKKDRPETIPQTQAPSRPKELECDIYHTSVKGEKWTVLIGLFGDRPYEVFCAQQQSFELSDKFKKGKIVKASGGKYHLDLGDFKIKDITSLLETDEHRVITRLLSTALRHGVSTDFLVDQLQKTLGTVTDFSKAILRVLKKYAKEDIDLKENCPICNSGRLKRVNGCPTCQDCGWSKCS